MSHISIHFENHCLSGGFIVHRNNVSWFLLADSGPYCLDLLMMNYRHMLQAKGVYLISSITRSSHESLCKSSKTLCDKIWEKRAEHLFCIMVSSLRTLKHLGLIRVQDRVFASVFIKQLFSMYIR